MPTPRIEKPGKSLGSDWGVVGGSHPLYGSYHIPHNPMSEHRHVWGRAVHQAACGLVADGVASWLVDGIRVICLVGPSARPVGMIKPTKREHSYDQGRLVYEHRKYIERLAAEGTISSHMVRRSLEIWGNLWTKCPDLTVPDAGAGQDGEVQYTWRQGDHYLSLDIIPNQPTEFFYRNRQTGAIWECEADETVSMVADELATHLRLFLISKTA